MLKHKHLSRVCSIYMQFWKLMIHCIESSTFPTSIQICETNATFFPFSKNHGHSIDCNDAPSTIDRWKAFQSKLKLLKIIDEVGLVSKDDPQKKDKTLKDKFMDWWNFARILGIQKNSSIITITTLNQNGYELNLL